MKMLRTVAASLTVFMMLFQAWAPTAFLISSVHAAEPATVSAQTEEPTPEPTVEEKAAPEAEPSPEPTAEPSAQPSAEPTAEPTQTEPSGTPEPSAQPTTEQEPPSDDADTSEESAEPTAPQDQPETTGEEANPTVTPEASPTPSIETTTVEKDGISWIINEETKEASLQGTIEEGKTYTSPFSDQVTITFTKLPKKTILFVPVGDEEHTLTMSEVTLTQQQMEKTGAVSPIGYEITSSLDPDQGEKKDFRYTLSLPRPDTDGGELTIVYAENREDINDPRKVRPVTASVATTDTSVEATDLDHFTVFIVVETIPGGITEGVTEVNPDCTAEEGASDRVCYDSIQEAIDAAVDGDIIIVQPGTYNEALIIDTEIELLGEPGAIIDGTGQTRAGISVQSGNVTVDGFRIQNSGNDGITVGYEPGGPGDLQNIVITNNEIEGTSGRPHGFGIYAGFEAEAFPGDPIAGNDGLLTDFLDYSGLIISGNSITNVVGAGIVIQSVEGVTGPLEVSDNTVSNVAAQSCLWVDSTKNLNVTGNDFSSCFWGMYISSISDGYFDVVGNTPFDTANVTATNNAIYDNAQWGVMIDDGHPDTFSFSENEIYGNPAGGMKNSLDQQYGIVPALNNWWGDASGPLDDTAGDGSIPDSNSGTESRVDGAIHYANWNTDGEPSSAIGAIQGRTFLDQNDNGLLLAADGDYPDDMTDGFQVRLYDASWTQVETQTTSSTGRPGQYRFENLAVDQTYYVCGLHQTSSDEVVIMPANGQTPVQTDGSPIPSEYAQAEVVTNQSGTTGEAASCWQVTPTRTQAEGGWLGIPYQDIPRPEAPQMTTITNTNTDEVILTCSEDQIGYTGGDELSDRQITISWEASDNEYIEYYWFGTKTRARHAQVMHPTTSYNGTMTPGYNPYWYTVIAVDQFGRESELAVVTADTDKSTVGSACGNVIMGEEPTPETGTIKIKKLICDDGAPVGDKGFRMTANGPVYDETEFRPTAEGMVLGSEFDAIGDDTFEGCRLADAEEMTFHVEYHPEDDRGDGQPNGPVEQVGTTYYTTNADGAVTIEDLSIEGRYAVREASEEGEYEGILGFACSRNGQGHGNTVNAGEYTILDPERGAVYNTGYCIGFNLPQEEPSEPPIAPACGENMIINGDFSQGNQDFESDYASTNIQLGEQYVITTNPRAEHNLFVDLPSNTDPMLLVNGGQDQSKAVWRQTVSGLEQDTEYQFAMDARSVYPDAPTTVYVRINGVIVEQHTLTSNVNQIDPVAVIWNSGSETEAVIEVGAMTTDWGGNDFAIDNLSFAQQECEPEPKMAEIFWVKAAQETEPDKRGGNGFAGVATESGTWEATVFDDQTNQVMGSMDNHGTDTNGGGSYTVGIDNNTFPPCDEAEEGEPCYDRVQVPAGTYRVEEMQQDGFEHVYGRCNQLGGNYAGLDSFGTEMGEQGFPEYQGGDAERDYARITLSEGQRTYCTFFNEPVEPEAPQAADITVCKDEQIDGVVSPYTTGWDMTLGTTEETVAQIQVASNDPSNGNQGIITESPELEPGTYRIVASGTYQYGSSTMIADAAYSKRDTVGNPLLRCGADAENPWVWMGSGTTCGITDALNLRVSTQSDMSDFSTNWSQPFASDHTYTFGEEITLTQAGKIYFTIFDDNYGDNQGGIDVEIIKVADATTQTTDQTGCTVFEDVPFGTYTLTEEMKEGWMVVTDPTTDGSITVGEEEPTEYRFVNEQVQNPEAPQAADITVCKDEQIDGVVSPYTTGWDMTLGGSESESLVQELTLDATNPNPEQTQVLDAGTQYRIEVEGTWFNGNRSVDAEYYSDDAWSTVEDMEDDTSRDPRQLDVVINDANVNWGTYDDGHNYETIVEGTDAALDMRIYDEDGDPTNFAWYQDNDGQLTVRIFEISTTEATTQTTDQTGCTVFEDVPFGTYTLTEETKEGWTVVTDPTTDGSITVGEEEPTEYRFVNEQDQTEQPEPEPQPEEPVGQLTIQKANNVQPNPVQAGATVTYTIQVTAEDDPINDVQVLDLPPEGFSYVKGSWTAQSNERGDLKDSGVTTEPTYASPGTWELGDLEAGEVVTLTYETTIANNQEDGLYTDLAWAKGDGADALTGTTVTDQSLANGTNSSYVDGEFVGTEVLIASDRITEAASVDVVTEETREEESSDSQGDVLGATTSLPETGARTIWMVIAGLLTGAGILMLGTGITMRNRDKERHFRSLFRTSMRVITAGAVVTTVMFMMQTGVHAADTSIRISAPEERLNTNTFKIAFVTLNYENEPVTVQCEKRGPTDTDYTPFGAAVTTAPGGDSGFCQVNQSVVGENGASYSFRATAAVDGVIVAQSNQIGTSYDDTDPDRPTGYSKSKADSCTYEITVTAANDEGESERLELYRAAQTNFTIEPATRIAVRPVNSGEQVTFTDVIPDCGQKYYYAVRAYDSFGNGSDVVADREVSVTVTTVSTGGGTTGGGTTEGTATAGDTGAAAGAILVEGGGDVAGADTGGGAGDDAEGEVAGEQTGGEEENEEATSDEEDENETNDSGEDVLGEQTENGTDEEGMGSMPWYILGGALVVIGMLLIYRFYGRKA